MKLASCCLCYKVVINDDNENNNDANSSKYCFVSKYDKHIPHLILNTHFIQVQKSMSKNLTLWHSLCLLLWCVLTADVICDSTIAQIHKNEYKLTH
jgi:hypothetical protein